MSFWARLFGSTTTKPVQSPPISRVICENCGLVEASQYGKGLLCDGCDTVLRTEGRRRIEIANESIQIANASTNVGTKLSRLRVAIEQAEACRNFGRWGLLKGEVSAGFEVDRLRSSADTLLAEHIRSETEKARSSASSAKSEKGRAQAYNRVIARLEKLAPDVPDVELLDTSLASLKAERDRF